MAGLLVTIVGGSGFVGRYIAQRLAKQGCRIRVAVRRPNEAKFVEPYGSVGQVVPMLCNIRNDDSVRAAVRGADVVVNCVGILDETSYQSFSSVQAEGAGRVARIAAEEGVGRMVHISAIGADAEAESEYSQTKAAGEALVLEHCPDAVILRPSIVFGPEDQFFNRFAGLSRLGPVLPITGGETKFQPVYVDDVAAAAEKAAMGGAKPGIYELGGPDVDSLRALIDQMLTIIRRRRLVFDMPTWMANLGATGLAVANFLSLGIIPPALTKDQIKSLKVDNVVSGDHKTFADLGIEPIAMEAILESYLWRFRPTGQYDEIKESARNLKA